MNWYMKAKRAIWAIHNNQIPHYVMIFNKERLSLVGYKLEYNLKAGNDNDTHSKS